MRRLALIPAALIMCGGIACAQTPSGQTSARHSTVQQGERGQSEADAPSTASSSRGGHRSTDQHSVVQQGERNQSTSGSRNQ